MNHIDRGQAGESGGGGGESVDSRDFRKAKRHECFPSYIESYLEGMNEKYK